MANRFKVPAIVLAIATLVLAPAAAQDWPSRPVTLVVPFAAGGPIDSIGRILATPLSERLGQQMIVENVGGAGGMTGTARVAKAPPDGYQIVLGNVGTHAGNQTIYRHPLYNAATDFAPVILVVELPLVLVARRNFPADDLRERHSQADRGADARPLAEPADAGVGARAGACRLRCVKLGRAVPSQGHAGTDRRQAP